MFFCGRGGAEGVTPEIYGFRWGLEVQPIHLLCCYRSDVWATSCVVRAFRPALTLCHSPKQTVSWKKLYITSRHWETFWWEMDLFRRRRVGLYVSTRGEQGGGGRGTIMHSWSDPLR